MVATPKSKPWLIAAWPGMGNVAMIGASYLVRQLGMKPVEELSATGYFDVQQVNVRAGVIDPARLPRSLFFRVPAKAGSGADEPGAGASGTDGVDGAGRTADAHDAEAEGQGARLRTAHELIVFIGDAQPTTDGFGFAKSILEHAASLGVERVITFASMSSQLHPSQEPRVFGAATDHDTLIDLKRLGVEVLTDGQIGGMNGVLLGAAAERGMSGLCLLGEIPFFAAGVPNPKGAKAVLQAFSALSGISIDLSVLAKDAKTVDKALIELLEKMKAQSREKEGGESEDEEEDAGEGEAEASAGENSAAKKVETSAGKRTLDQATQARIEQLFTEAGGDRSKGVGLKQELDRLGVFKQYENRFLDLFKRAG